MILKFLKTVHPVGQRDFAEDFGPLWGRQQLLQPSLCLSHWICTRSICKRGDERPFCVPILYMASRIGISIHLFLLVLHYEAKEQIFQQHWTAKEAGWMIWACLTVVVPKVSFGHKLRLFFHPAIYVHCTVHEMIIQEDARLRWSSDNQSRRSQVIRCLQNRSDAVHARFWKVLV